MYLVFAHNLIISFNKYFLNAYWMWCTIPGIQNRHDPSPGETFATAEENKEYIRYLTKAI